MRRDDAVVRFLSDAIQHAGDGLPRFGKLDRRALRALARDLWPELRPLIGELVREALAKDSTPPPTEYLAPMREGHAITPTTTPSEEPARVVPLKVFREKVRETTAKRTRVADARDARAMRVTDVPASAPEVTPSAQPTPWTFEKQEDALGRLRAVVARRGAESWMFAVERNVLERIERVVARANDGRAFVLAVERNTLDRIARVTASLPEGLWNFAPVRTGGKVAGVRVTRPDGTTRTQEAPNVGA